MTVLWVLWNLLHFWSYHSVYCKVTCWPHQKHLGKRPSTVCWFPMLWQNFMEVMDVRKSWSKSRRPWETYRSLLREVLRNLRRPGMPSHAKSNLFDQVATDRAEALRPELSNNNGAILQCGSIWPARRSHEIHGAWNCQLVLVETKPSEASELCELCEPCQPPRNEDQHRQRISKLVKLLDPFYHYDNCDLWWSKLTQLSRAKKTVFLLVRDWGECFTCPWCSLGRHARCQFRQGQGVFLQFADVIWGFP